MSASDSHPNSLAMVLVKLVNNNWCSQSPINFIHWSSQMHTQLFLFLALHSVPPCLHEPSFSIRV